MTTLRVEDNNWLDLHVYVVRDGESFSLGTVMGPGKTKLTVPAMATIPGSQVQLLVLPIGGADSYLSQPLVVEPGDTLNLTVENDLAMSSVTVSAGS